MLTDISIKNFAIIDSLHLSFGPGLTVLTGETGAGKSIIIDAVSLVLGGRASSDLIRTGVEEATVEAFFAVADNPAVQTCCADAGIDCADELLVKRIISRSGRNRIFINGSLSTLATLAEITARLINIYGQHESQTLLRVENHLSLLDGYAALHPARDRFAGLWREYRTVREQLASLDSRAGDAARQQDLLTYQLDEIGRAALRSGEDDELDSERHLLVNAEKLSLRTMTAYDLLYGAEASALGMLAAVRSALGEAAAIDATLAPIAETVASSCLQLDDAALQIRNYNGRIESDPQRLQVVDDRLELIRRLKKKYGASIDEVLATAADLERQLRALADTDHCREELELELERLHGLLRQQGADLTSARHSAADRFCRALAAEVHQLGMKHALFSLRFEPCEEPRESGFERAEILFAPNPGEEPRPLARIASGGELSRIMLAIKQIHPDSDVPTLVFDEVDTGIGGATAAMVGRKLKTVASRQQVLCITHLPQVAVFADSHVRVAKAVVDGRTQTSLALLDADDRVNEIARMLGGAAVTAKSVEHAAEMIASAHLA